MYNYLALYSITGKQKYIFRSNKVKEIIGASLIIKDIFNDFYKDTTIHENQYNVIFALGGKGLIQFKCEDEMLAFNKEFSQFVLNQTYSLPLIIATTKISSSFSKDYQQLMLETQSIKANKPNALPLGALPFVSTEDNTGLPLSIMDGDKFYSKETYLKRLKLKDYYEKYSNSSVYNEIRHNEIAEKNIDSTIAIIHIDGNNIGQLMQDFFKLFKADKNYTEAISSIEQTTKDLNDIYLNTFKVQRKNLEDFIENQSKIDQSKIYMREIIAAGDDITFIVNAQFAFSITTAFLKKIEENEINNIKMSACAGIAFCHSHFPYSEAYKVAEKLCENAKSYSKASKSHKSWIDFQIVSHMGAANLDDYRKQHYRIDNKYNLIKRPYVCSSCNTGKPDIQEFLNHMTLFQSKKYPNNLLMQIREAYSQGLNELELVKQKMISRGHDFFDSSGKFFDEYNQAKYYDALEFFDKYTKILTLKKLGE